MISDQFVYDTSENLVLKLIFSRFSKVTTLHKTNPTKTPDVAVFFKTDDLHHIKETLNYIRSGSTNQLHTMESRNCILLHIKRF